MDKRMTFDVKVPQDHEQNFYAGVQGDMAYGGVFVEMAKPPEPGEAVEVAITLPDGGRVRVHGAVRWIRTSDLATESCPAGAGIAWQAIDRRSVLAVRRYLAQKNRRRPGRVAALKAA